MKLSLPALESQEFALVYVQSESFIPLKFNGSQHLPGPTKMAMAVARVLRESDSSSPRNTIWRISSNANFQGVKK
jgi:hypothetical protein